MKLFVNRKVRVLLNKILLYVLGFTLISAVLLIMKQKNAALLIFLASFVTAAATFVLCCGYFVEQEKELEEATSKITAYLSGDVNARIPCAEEGELYRLFHEVNSLAAILNAHAENERKSKVFLQDTIANISHQLKTPLAALNIYNGILQSEAQTTSTIREFTDLSEKELDRIEVLVQNLLKMAKLDAGTVVLEKAEENVADLLSSIEKRFAFRAKQEEKALVLSGSEAIALPCDRSWLTEALGNLVKNALEHTQPGNSIRLTWKSFAAAVQIVITDNGCGIHPEDLPHVFERFYRSRFSNDTQGVGLGLPLAKAIIEAHGGTIELESEPGIGTTFTLYFPIPTKL